MIVLNPENEDCLKHFYIPDNKVVTIEDIHVKHRDSHTPEFIDHIAKFDVLGYTMRYKFQPINYVFIYVSFDITRKSVFVGSVQAFDSFLLKSLFNSEARIKFNSSDGVPVW